MKYFVWIKGLRGPEPQVWDDKDKTQEGKPIETLFAVECSDDAKLSDLIALYPYEVKP